jgi:hypothetical protein
MKTWENLVPNIDHETKKQEKHDMCEIKIQQYFIANEI